MEERIFESNQDKIDVSLNNKHDVGWEKLIKKSVSSQKRVGLPAEGWGCLVETCE